MNASAIVVGIDLVVVAQIRSSVERFGERFLRRFYTPGELEKCFAAPAIAPSRLAARFAAKEAARKVLRIGDEGFGWTTIEVRTLPSGAPELALHGEARALATRAGLEAFSLSMTHEADYASAVVVGQRGNLPAGATCTGIMAGATCTGLSHSSGEGIIMNEDIIGILRDHGRLAVAIDTLTDHSDLYESGLTSHASVNVMLALEGKFDVEFPDRMLKRGVFGSISSIRAALEELTASR